eukprot:scaffold132872_cov35-Tisochrysis_lutea.AAC.4
MHTLRTSSPMIRPPCSPTRGERSSTPEKCSAATTGANINALNAPSRPKKSVRSVGARSRIVTVYTAYRKAETMHSMTPTVFSCGALSGSEANAPPVTSPPLSPLLSARKALILSALST